MPKEACDLWQGRGLPVRSTPCHVALLGCIVLGGLSCGSADDDCASLLRIKSPPATIPCPNGQEAMCSYLASTGKDVEAHFSFAFDVPADASGVTDQKAAAHYQQCVIKYFANYGLSGFLDDYDQQVAGRVSVNSTYLQAVPAASRLALLTYFDVNCWDGAKCEDCLPMSTDRCIATPMCHVLNGRLVDLSQGCADAAQPLGCLPLGYVDELGIEFLRDPQGNCWVMEWEEPPARATETWTWDGTCTLPGHEPYPLCQNPPAP